MHQIGRVGIETKGTVSLQDLINEAKNNPEVSKGGAIVTFTGIVRGYTHDGKKVSKLEIEAHDVEATKALAKISEELRKWPGVVDVLIHHLTGEFNVGEDLVYVVVIGSSRVDAFQAIEEAVNRYKKEAALWKKEYLEDDSSYWISE